MSQRDRHIIDIVAEDKATLIQNGTIDDFQSAFSSDGYMGFRWSADLLQENGGVHIFPSEGKNTFFNTLSLSTGVTGMGILSPLDVTTKLLGITVDGSSNQIKYINDIAFTANGNLITDKDIFALGLTSATNLTLTAQDRTIILKTPLNGGVSFFNGTTNVGEFYSSGKFLNFNGITDISDYEDKQLVTADAIKTAIVTPNPSQGVADTLNTADGLNKWQSTPISVVTAPLGSEVTIDANKTTFKLHGIGSVVINGAAQELNISGTISAPALDANAIESNIRSLVTLEYCQANFGAAGVLMYGPTADRPGSAAIGFPYFDTDLADGTGHTIWWSGTDWVNATGNIV